MSGVFETVKIAFLEMIALSFKNDLGFLAHGKSVENVAQIFQFVKKTVIE